MGRLTIGVVEGLDGFEVGGLYAPGHDGEQVLGYTCSADPGSVAGDDIVVEFTRPDASDINVPRWRDNGAHVVVGTSGYTVDRVDELRAGWTTAPGRCLVVPNFAVGAVLMMRFAELAAPHFEASEVIEMHHEDKPDAPSGTALATAARIAAAQNSRGGDRGSELVPGALGADVEGVAVHSLRLPGSIAHQEVVFGTTGQYLTIRHDTTNYTAFVPGLELAIRTVGGLSVPVTVGLETLLGV